MLHCRLCRDCRHCRDCRNCLLDLLRIPFASDAAGARLQAMRYSSEALSGWTGAPMGAGHRKTGLRERLGWPVPRSAAGKPCAMDAVWE